MFDGLPLTGPGGRPYELFEPPKLSRAEVLRGANGFDAGALALGGSINYVTRIGYDAAPLQVRYEAAVMKNVKAPDRLAKYWANQ